MYSLTIILEPLSGKRDELAAACLAVVDASRMESGCLFFDVLVGEGAFDEVVFYEAYCDEAAFQAHMASPHTKEWQARALPLVEKSRIRFPAHRGIAGQVGANDYLPLPGNISIHHIPAPCIIQ